MFEVAIAEDDSSVAPESGIDDPQGGNSVADGAAPAAVEDPMTRRRWRGWAAAAVVVLLLIALTVTALGWNDATGRADRLATSLRSTRGELASANSEASNLRKQVGNLEDDKKVLNAWVEELKSENDDLQIHNDDLTSTNEAISTVVQRLNQCLTETREIGRQLFDNAQPVPEERIRRALAQCAAAQAAAAVLKAATNPDDSKAV